MPRHLNAVAKSDTNLSETNFVSTNKRKLVPTKETPCPYKTKNGTNLLPPLSFNFSIRVFLSPFASSFLCVRPFRSRFHNFSKQRSAHLLSDGVTESGNKTKHEKNRSLPRSLLPVLQPLPAQRRAHTHSPSSPQPFE